MITAIRAVRRAKGLTLDDVARRCDPPTTAQTIGRLETGTRTVSVGWLNRIAAALDVAAVDLVTMPERADLPVVAILDSTGIQAPTRPNLATPPHVEPGQVAVTVAAGVGEFYYHCDFHCPPMFGQLTIMESTPVEGSTWSTVKATYH